jgi:hypothetical protein
MKDALKDRSCQAVALNCGIPPNFVYNAKAGALKRADPVMYEKLSSYLEGKTK